MNRWCESCARKNLCYVVDDRPKCFVPITNTASGTPYLVGISSISRDNHEIAKDEPQTEMTTEQVVNELLSIKKIIDDGKMPKQTHEIRTNTHECVKDTHDKTEQTEREGE